MGSGTELSMLLRSKARPFLSVYVDDKNATGRKRNLDPEGKKLMKLVDLGVPTSFLDHENWGCI